LAENAFAAQEGNYGATSLHESKTSQLGMSKLITANTYTHKYSTLRTGPVPLEQALHAQRGHHTQPRPDDSTEHAHKNSVK